MRTHAMAAPPPARRFFTRNPRAESFAARYRFDVMLPAVQAQGRFESAIFDGAESYHSPYSFNCSMYSATMA